MRCPSCGKLGAASARFCDRCGASLGPSQGDPTGTGLPSAPDGHRRGRPSGGSAADRMPAGDRRIVTALFADLVDYVRMLAEHDPEEVRDRVTRALAAMADAIERLDGTREKFIGDAVFAVFGWPRAHDDDAVRAALAALAIRAGLREIGDGLEPMEVRIGLATGEVVAAGDRPDADGDLGLTGEAITTAARIQSLAGPGEIVLDSATRQAARGRLATEPRGSVVLRGRSTAVELHALLGEAGTGAWIPYRAEAPGPLIGRTAERRAIEDAIARTRRTGRGEVLVLVGEAGMGKSRLLAAAEAPARTAGFAWTWTENLSYRRGEPYRWARLFAQTVADEHGIDSGGLARRLLFTDDLAPAEVRRFGGAISAVARDAAFSGWETEAADMPSDPVEIASTLREVAGRYLDRLLETTGPRVVVIDDLHFLDASSVAMVELTVDRSMSSPLLVLAGTRPGAMPAWIHRPNVRRLQLGGLAESESARLATIVARAALDSDGARAIHERTAGNPLFVTETVRAFLEDGTLERRGGRVAFAGLVSDRLPVTLRAVLGARIDALARDVRETLGVASVIGIAFTEGIVSELLEGRPVAAALDRLAAAALVAPVGGGRWRFAHALIRDAAYAGMLASRRRQLHGRLADRLAVSAEAAAPGLIAAHRVAAGDLTRAIPLLRDAAADAHALGALTEAAAFWRQAADLGATDDPAAAALDRARADGVGV